MVVRWRAEDRAADRSATDPRTLEVVVVQVEVLRVEVLVPVAPSWEWRGWREGARRR